MSADELLLPSCASPDPALKAQQRGGNGIFSSASHTSQEAPDSARPAPLNSRLEPCKAGRTSPSRSRFSSTLKSSAIGQVFRKSNSLKSSVRRFVVVHFIDIERDIILANNGTAGQTEGETQWKFK